MFENHGTLSKKVKVTFDGFYIENAIVINKQKNIRRKIFTLLHKSAHHLLNKEGFDVDVKSSIERRKIERWCNNFAFYFLLNDQIKNYEKMNVCNEKMSIMRA